MVLRNLDNLSTAFSIGKRDNEFGTDTSTFGDGHLNIKDITGTIYKPYTHSQMVVVWNSYLNSTDPKYGLVLGTGDTPVSYDDFKITVANNLTAQAHAWSTPVYENGKIKTTITRVFVSSVEQTIKEIGFYSDIWGSNTYKQLCIYREVLETPIVVPANGSIEVTITLYASTNPNEPVQVSTNIK